MNSLFFPQGISLREWRKTAIIRSQASVNGGSKMNISL
jgi:hypothetical protein